MVPAAAGSTHLLHVQRQTVGLAMHQLDEGVLLLPRGGMRTQRLPHKAPCLLLCEGRQREAHVAAGRLQGARRQCRVQGKLGSCHSQGAALGTDTRRRQQVWAAWRALHARVAESCMQGG